MPFFLLKRIQLDRIDLKKTKDGGGGKKLKDKLGQWDPLTVPNTKKKEVKEKRFALQGGKYEKEEGGHLAGGGPVA